MNTPTLSKMALLLVTLTTGLAVTVNGRFHTNGSKPVLWQEPADLESRGLFYELKMI